MLKDMTIDPRSAPADTRIAVRVQHVHKYFGTGEQRVAALQDVSWDVYSNQLSMITGPSGCGKTTLGRCVMRAYQPTGGEILYRDGRRRWISPRSRTLSWSRIAARCAWSSRIRTVR